jgi:transposase-like protein
MSVTNTPIAGTGSSAEPIIPAEGLEPDVTPTPEGQEPDTSITPEPEVSLEPGKEGQEPIKEDGRTIPKWVKDLQTSNPEAYKRAKADFFETRERRTIHPTVQAARDEHDLVQSLGGQGGITELRENAGVFKTAAQQFLKGDPAFVKDLWDEDPIAAALHVAPMLETYKARDLAGYKSTVARLWDQEFQAVGFGNGIKLLMDAIKAKDFDGATGLANEFKAWYESIGNEARKAEDPRVKSLLAERAKQVEDRAKGEQAEFTKGFRTDAVNMAVEEAGKVFDSFFRGRKLEADDRMDLLQDAIKLADRVLAADSQFMAQRQTHLDNGDKIKAVQLTKARLARELPEAVKKIARRYGMVSNTAPAQRQQTQQQQQQPRVEQGWTAVNARPTAEEVDRGPGKTTNEMILSGKAILKSGKKVDWSALKKV